VLPTFAVVPTLGVNRILFEVLRGNLLGVVHAGQTIRMHRAFDPGGTVVTVGTVKAIYDLKRMARSVVTTETRTESGALVCETEWSIIYRLDGGFGGPPPPPPSRIRIPERAPDFRVEERTSAEQAFLYRLSGDHNPLHVDPEIAEQAGFDRPILHGLCTYGYVGRAVVNAVGGGDPARLTMLSGEFRKPVWPGDTLVTEGYREGDRWLLRVATTERPGDFVFSNAMAEIR
jgi:acyl dehydratase